MKKLILIAVIIVSIIIVGCSLKDESPKIAGRVFTYEKDGFGGSFAILFIDDGTFSYSEGSLSSHIGLGGWEIKNGKLTLTEGDKTYIFKLDGDDMIYEANGSDSFIYVKLEDGARFKGTGAKPIASAEAEPISARSEIDGKLYTYEKDGFGGSFVILFIDDGTFSYSEGHLSSHIGLGGWEIKNGKLTLTEGDKTYIFKLDGEDMIYEADGSDSFIYVKLEDGARFKGTGAKPLTSAES